MLTTVLILCMALAGDWRVGDVQTIDRARPSDAPVAGKSYLHIKLETNDPNLRKHKFRIVDATDKEVGELWGWTQNNTLIFEGDWTSLYGLWLADNDHREPLFTIAKEHPSISTRVIHNPPAKAGRTAITVPATADVIRPRYEVIGGRKVEILYNGDGQRITYIYGNNLPPGFVYNTKGVAIGPGSGEGPGSGPGPGPGSAAPGPGPGPGEGPGPGPGPGDKGDGKDCGEGPGPGPGTGGGPGPGGGPGNGPGKGKGKAPYGNQGCPDEIKPYNPVNYKDIPPPLPKEIKEGWTLYISTGDELSKGIVYQTDEHGRVLGKVNLPYTATSIALHRDNALMAVMPRGGGSLLRIDDTGRVDTVLSNDKVLTHPTRVAVPANSDVVVVADDNARIIAATSTGGVRPKVYQRLGNMENPSIAVTNDKYIIYSDDNTYRYSGDKTGVAPVLPEGGQVAADPKSLRWAVATGHNTIGVYEEDKLIKKLKLPAGKSLYKRGLLSFSPVGTLCVACRDSGGNSGVWLLMYDIDSNKVRSLFPWKDEEMQSFVVGPRMLWNRKSPSNYKSVY